VGPVIYSGVIFHDGRAACAAQSEAAAVAEEAMTCGERARPRLGRLVLVGGTGERAAPVFVDKVALARRLLTLCYYALRVEPVSILARFRPVGHAR
jgi:hypothetical protein